MTVMTALPAYTFPAVLAALTLLVLAIHWLSARRAHRRQARLESILEAEDAAWERQRREDDLAQRRREREQRRA